MQLFGDQKSCISNKFWQNADGAGPWTRAAETAGGMAQRTHLEKHLMCQNIYSDIYIFIPRLLTLFRTFITSVSASQKTLL